MCAAVCMYAQYVCIVVCACLWCACGVCVHDMNTYAYIVCVHFVYMNMCGVHVCVVWCVYSVYVCGVCLVCDIYVVSIYACVHAKM